MKIRARLTIAFLIMTIFPVAAGAFCFHSIMESQNNVLNAYYSADTDSLKEYDFILNPVGVFHSLTSADYGRLVNIADKTPDKLLDKDFLETLELSLSKRETFLVLKREGENYFVGNPNSYKRLSPLPPFTVHENGNDSRISIDKKNSMMIRQKDFHFSDGSEGQLFLINDLSKLLPRWKKSIREICVAFILILILTSLLLTFWIHHSIVRPLNILHIATMQIGAGDLNHPVRITSEDEIGELCRDFEEMRTRLKSILEERIQYENDIREMTSNISHDLKTPLTAIKGYTEGLLDGVADTKEKQDKYLQTIFNKADDMTCLVDELSLFSMIEQDTLPYQFISLDLADYFSDCIDGSRLDLEAKGISLHFENHTPAKTRILADPEHLKRVIQNIIGNTAKYMDKENREILIVLKEHNYSQKPLYRQINRDGTDVKPAQKALEYIKVEISDNGPGIAAKDLPHIFERFYRADASRSSKTGGSGLGLAIAQKIISDHGGSIYAASTLGSGTSIYFTLKKDN